MGPWPPKEAPHLVKSWPRVSMWTHQVRIRFESEYVSEPPSFIRVCRIYGAACVCKRVREIALIWTQAPSILRHRGYGRLCRAHLFYSLVFRGSRCRFQYGFAPRHCRTSSEESDADGRKIASEAMKAIGKTDC